MLEITNLDKHFGGLKAVNNANLRVKKGSITINGVSLTISKILNFGFQIVIIPQTLKLTNLIYLRDNDIVNVEFDVLGKYINSFLK